MHVVKWNGPSEQYQLDINLHSKNKHYHKFRQDIYQNKMILI